MNGQKMLSWAVLIFILGLVFCMVFPMFKQNVITINETQLVSVGKDEAGNNTYLLWVKGLNGGGDKVVTAGVAGLAGIASLLSALWRVKK